MKVKSLVILSFLTLLSLKSFATHIVGGEIYYDCLGSNNYRITLKLYRDCYNGIPPFDNPASIFIFDNSGTFIDSLEIPAPASVILPFPLGNPCLTPPTNICVEEAIYQVVVNLPPLAGGYDFTYQRCCRNGTILNLLSPGDIGSTYMAHIPDPGLAICNSSPHYNNYPPIFLCTGIPLNLIAPGDDHSATDPDGDSLYYELCDPLTGLSPNCPILGTPALGNGCPPIASPPPYPFVPWLAPYSGIYPMSASPALAVNPVTGLMTGTPNMIGQWVVAVCVSEYRNGVLLDVNKRDFQFNVVNCGALAASIPLQQPFCFGSPSIFTQNSTNAFTYHWDFGDPGTSLDTSNVLSPTWTYDSLGTYTLTLIVNSGTTCSDTASIQVTANPPPPVALILNSDTVCISQGGFILTGGAPSNGTYSGLGVIGDYFYPSLVSIGMHNIVYSYTDSNNCSDNDTAQIFVDVCAGQSEIFNPQPSITISPNPTSGVFQTQISIEHFAISSQYKIEIYNVLGEKVYATTKFKIQTINEVDLSSQPNGVYFLHLKTERGRIVKKIIISKE